MRAATRSASGISDSASSLLRACTLLRAATRSAGTLAASRSASGARDSVASLLRADALLRTAADSASAQIVANAFDQPIPFGFFGLPESRIVLRALAWPVFERPFAAMLRKLTAELPLHICLIFVAVADAFLVFGFCRRLLLLSCVRVLGGNFLLPAVLRFGVFFRVLVGETAGVFLFRVIRSRTANRIAAFPAAAAHFRIAALNVFAGVPLCRRAYLTNRANAAEIRTVTRGGRRIGKDQRGIRSGEVDIPAIDRRAGLVQQLLRRHAANEKKQQRKQQRKQLKPQFR